ncbi:DISARM system helicase DrmA [Nocardiopsis sp. LDBS0036]|uniref:DISARM system helicase DrmA n=1 Tax=Nocardiopsis sp. LDBS0036 TaxID=3104276 RepID=UPI0035123674
MGDDRVLTPPTPREIRAELEELVVGDLYGPVGGDEHEQFPTTERVTDRYILGRLAPNGALVDPDDQDRLAESGVHDSVSFADADTDGDTEPEAPSVPSMFCNAHGFTVCVEPGTTELLARASWAVYRTVANPEGEGRLYQRHPHSAEVRVPLPEQDTLLRQIELDPEQPAIVLRGRVRSYDGRRLVTLFLVNGQQGKESSQSKWLFQAEFSVSAPDGHSPVFVPRPESFSGGDKSDRDEQRNLAMTHRFHAEFAVGHSTAVTVETAPGDPLRAVRVGTSAVPGHELRHTDVPSADKDEDLPELADLVVDMSVLGREDGTAPNTREALSPLVDGYRSWIARQRDRIDDPATRLVHDGADFRDSALANLREASRAADRIAAAIDLLDRDPNALAAFRFANRAMHRQRVHSIAAAGDPRIALDDRVAAVDEPRNRSWRPFQLAFLLLNLPSLTDPAHPERSGGGPGGERTADLLWFPTGGGKTEAYLGLTAYTLAIRRLQAPTAVPRTDTGVAVLMRYTLRLLTIQQFQRAAALICACEVERRQDPDRWGAVPFRLGLWVGGKVTPNSFKGAEDWVKDKRTGKGGGGHGSPHQLMACPWCGHAINPGQDIEVDAVARRTHVLCPEFECAFSSFESDGEGIPVVVVDEEIYRLVPSLVIATVDKFAQLTWKGEAQTLFGRAERYCQRHGFLAGEMNRQACEGAAYHKAGNKSPYHPAAHVVHSEPVRPPDLIVQDELHLITGPLGSLVGLYETAVDLLAGWNHLDPLTGTSHKVRPKVIASTATVRRANRQIAMLFGGRRTRVFPPQGLDAEDTFFSRQRPIDQHDGRRYVGICAHGVRVKSTQIRVYVAVMAAGQRLHDKYGANEVTDPYMTLVGYFNSLRDLGGMRRMVDDDVATRLSRADERGLAQRDRPWVEELTSRLGSDDIPRILEHLGKAFTGGKGKGTRPLDVLLATNMIAVGVDVPRLGAMVVSGQPKSAAEYIQATSRVGRRHPGIVFTVYNWARPRDLSHYERFENFHATLYRHVEALSVTPFAARAIDRGLTGLLVAMARNYDGILNPNHGAGRFDRTGQTADHVAAEIKRRAQLVSGSTAQARRVAEQVDQRMDLWHERRSRQTTDGVTLAYRPPKNSPNTVGLLTRPEEGRWRLTTAPNSLREVEPGIRLILNPEDTLGDAAAHPFTPPIEEGQDQS